MNNIPPINTWTRVFIDTTFIIDCLIDLGTYPNNTKRKAIKNAQKLKDYFKSSVQKIKWVTSSIVLSELTKFDSKDAVLELQILFDSPDLEIINFTSKEAAIIVNNFGDFLEQKHVSAYLKEVEKSIQGVFNPKNFVSNDALIIACAKSKHCDVVLTSDVHSFVPIANQVNLPILKTEDLPIDMYDNIDHALPIKTNY